MWYKNLVRVSRRGKWCIRTSPNHSVTNCYRSLLLILFSPLRLMLSLQFYLFPLFYGSSHVRSGTFLQIYMIPARSCCRLFYPFMVFLSCSLKLYLYYICSVIVLGGQRSTCCQICTSLFSSIPSKSSLFSYFLCFAFVFLVNKSWINLVYKGAQSKQKIYLESLSLIIVIIPIR